MKKLFLALKKKLKKKNKVKHRVFNFSFLAIQASVWVAFFYKEFDVSPRMILGSCSL